MIAEWEETVKKYTEQAESQNDNLAEDQGAVRTEAKRGGRDQDTLKGVRRHAAKDDARTRERVPIHDRDERESAVSPRLGQRAGCLGNEESCREAELEGNRC